MNPDTGGLGIAATGTGAALTSLAASACCVPVFTPLIIGVVGASGAAWAAGLQPYRPYILVGTAILIGYGFRSVYRRRNTCSVNHGTTTREWTTRLSKGALFIATAIWLASVGLPLLATGF
ncbi:MAG TPA: mercuric transporter MerT family protein [Gemmatimonadota bacterium]|nr:mercuric transporter MerT family protein [Gemmatimonadota bacterium]